MTDRRTFHRTLTQAWRRFDRTTAYVTRDRFDAAKCQAAWRDYLTVQEEYIAWLESQ